jgi:hypothetical protein
VASVFICSSVDTPFGGLFVSAILLVFELVAGVVGIGGLVRFLRIKDNELNAIEKPAKTITIIDFYRYSTTILDYVKSSNSGISLSSDNMVSRA